VKRWIALSVVTTAMLAGCRHTALHPAAVTSGVFAYDATRPLQLSERAVRAAQGVRIHDVSYASGANRVPAFIVEPTRAGRLPGVVLVHGSGGDRNELLQRAIALARLGAVTMTITEPSTLHPPPTPRSVAALLNETRATTVANVVAIRRAADVLASRPDVNSTRLGYLGWSAGAKTGAFIAASDRRFKALALLSAGADPVSAFTAAAPPADRELVRSVLASIDPIAFASRARAGSLLLEDGTRDALVPHSALENIIRAAPRGTIVRWYAAGHALNDAAYRAAFIWLLHRLRQA
jgi:dienelactone hydrolase